VQSGPPLQGLGIHIRATLCSNKYFCARVFGNIRMGTPPYEHW